MDINTELDEQKQKSRVESIISVIQRKLTLRLAVQAFIVLIFIVAAIQFYGFYQSVQGYEGYSTERPASVEGFLPIAAIVAFKAMFVTGEIDPIHPAGLVIFLAILLTSWIFRRALCSWICPIGTLSEYLGKLGQKVMGRNFMIPKWLDGILLLLKYGLFAYILKEFIFLPSDYAVSFMQLPYYTISDVKMFEMFLNLGLMAIAFIGTLMLLSFLFKNFWCRYLCPYGAMVGLFGILSPIVLKKEKDNCIKCGKCNKVCPSKVDVMGKNNMVISTECTGCTSCVTACPKKDVIQFKLFGIVPVKPLYFSIGFIVLFFGVILLAKITGHWDSIATLTDYQSIFSMGGGGF